MQNRFHHSVHHVNNVSPVVLAQGLMFDGMNVARCCRIC